MAFVRDVIRGRGRGMEEAALRVFDPKPRDGDMKPPLSREELRARQDRFYGEGALRIAREAGAGRSLLVTVQCGAGFDAPWLDKPRTFDVLLNYYQEAEPNPRADAVALQAGTKTTAIRRLLAERPDILLRYEAALFLDDDIELGAADIDALFAAMARENLDLAQPALTVDSECAWAFLKRPDAPEGLFRVSTVEIMAPLMTRRALKAAGFAFSETGQRLGDRSPPRPGGSRGLRTGKRRGDRIGRGPACAQGRHDRAAPSTPISDATGSIRLTRPTGSSPTSAWSGYLSRLAPGDPGQALRL